MSSASEIKSQTKAIQQTLSGFDQRGKQKNTTHPHKGYTALLNAIHSDRGDLPEEVQSYLDELPSAADFETALQQMNKSLKSKNVGMSALTILMVLIVFFVVNVMDSMLVVLQSVVCNKLIAKVAFILLILAMKPALTY